MKTERTIQIFVKVDGFEALPPEVSLSDKVGDVVKRIPRSASANVTCAAHVKEG